MKYGFLVFEGEGVADFLQGQLTNDVHAMKAGEAAYAACCNRQGRVVATFYLLCENKIYTAIVPQAMQGILHDHLFRYAQVSSVTIHEGTIEEDSGRVGSASRDCLRQWALSVGELIDAELAMIMPATSAKFLPQALSLDRHGALCFKKGCYLGQEIVARVEYKGRVKQRLAKLTVAEDAFRKMMSNRSDSDEQGPLLMPGDHLADLGDGVEGTVLLSEHRHCEADTRAGTAAKLGDQGLVAASGFLKVLAVVPC